MGGEVKSMRTATALVGLGFLIAACGTPHGGPQLNGGYKLYEAVSSNNSQLVSVIDSRSHAAERRLPLGVPSRDWKHLYSIVGSSLVDTDPQTGTTLNTMLLPGRYQLPPATITGMPGGTSPDGRWLVVESFDQSSPNSLPTATHMLLIDTTASKVMHRANLKGYFQFDAVSNDGERLYLIEYLNGKEYYVRLYNVSASILDANIVVDKSDGNQAMAGIRLSGVASPDGHWLFSMYVRENESSFVHVLSLDGPFAFCVDLPGSGYANNPAEMHWSLAMDPAEHVYAVNAVTGVVSEIDGAGQFNPRVKRTGHIAGGKSAKTGYNAAVISPDGKTLVTPGATGVEWIDTQNLTVRMQALNDWHVGSLGLSPDGKTLYAISDTGRIAEVSMNSGEVAHTFDPAEGQPMALMRVAVS
jgi:DNA-binding beta-propeller fold protein YncE